MSSQLSSIQEFLESLEKFVNILAGAKNNMDGRVTLSDHGLGQLLDELNSPSDYLSAGRLNICFSWPNLPTVMCAPFGSYGNVALDG